MRCSIDILCRDGELLGGDGRCVGQNEKNGRRPEIWFYAEHRGKLNRSGVYGRRWRSTWTE